MNILLNALSAALLLVPMAQDEPKTVLSSLDDLPPRTYPLECTVDELVESPEQLCTLAAMLRKDLEADLARYDFAAPAVEREFYSMMLQVDLALDRLDDALLDIQAMRRLSDKEALKHMSALHAEAWVRARIAAGPEAGIDEQLKVYAAILREAVTSLPSETVRPEISKRRLKIQMASEGMIRMMLSSVKSALADDGSIDASSAHTLIGMCNALSIIVPIKDVTVKIYGDFLLNKDRGPRIPVMTERKRALKPTDPGRPVVVAVWDTGVDVDVFPDRLFINPGERADGKDTDGNGYIDDLHGIAFELDLESAQGLLMPIDLDASARAKAQRYLQGVEDRRTGHETPESAEVKKLAATLEKDGRRELSRMVALYDFYCHGTHVAGIAVEGNPFARILVVRVNFDDEALKTEEWAHDFVAMCRDTVAYFKASSVRVVNLSWGWDVHEIEDNLKAHGAGADAGERAVMAGKIFAILEEGLREALAGAPEILFVNGAGKAPGDPVDYRWIPGIFDLPNVIPVGAVDAFGEMTPFSIHGPHVRLFADGFHVDSVVPGGARMKLSGTSMATPQVTNVAAKLFALEPSLTPQQVIALMIEGGETVERGSKQLTLLNPCRSIELMP